MDEYTQQVGLWLKRHPGCFERPTARECWRAAHEHFAGPHMRYDPEFEMALDVHGIHVFGSVTGGFILAWIDR